VTARRPRHAQPCGLADVRWSSGAQRGLVLALLSAVAVGAAGSGGLTTRPAAAAVPRAAVVDTTQPPGSSAADLLAAGLPARGMSAAPRSSTAARRRADPLDIAQASALASDGIPTTALQAYQNAARRELTVDPTCGLSWPLLAGIGRVESDHGRFAGAVLHTDGASTPHIIGIPLDGNGTARILDTDRGRLDGDTVYDRAVGSMQFIPSTWAGYGADGNGDGIIDPFNVFDAAAAAAHYLCVAGGNLTTLAGQTRAVRAYNDSDAYIALVLQLERVYARGVPGLTVPILPAGSALPTQRSTVPPANPGPPLAVLHGSSKKPTPSGSRSTSDPLNQSSGPTSSATPTTTTLPNPSGTSCATSTVGDSPSASPSATSTGTAADRTTPPGGTTSAGEPTSSSPRGAGDPISPGIPPESSATC
jgi:membrane-bound lytic murein transglycosylase B